MTKTLMFAMFLSACSFSLGKPSSSTMPGPNGQQSARYIPTGHNEALDNDQALQQQAERQQAQAQRERDQEAAHKEACLKKQKASAAVKDDFTDDEAERYCTNRQRLADWKRDEKEHPEKKAEIDEERRKFLEAEAAHANEIADDRAANLVGTKKSMFFRESGSVFGVGQKVLTAMEFKQAKLAFKIFHNNDDNTYELHRYTFVGDKLDNETIEGFAHRPGPQHFQ